MKLSLILPIYNGRKELERNFMQIYKDLEKIGTFEIIIAEDGSTDGTKEVAARFAKMKNVRLISRSQRAGKGRAVKDGIAIARGDIIGYMDIDLAVPLRYVKYAVGKVGQGNKIVIGSRYSVGSDASRTKYRWLESVLYNYMMQFLLGSKVKDHQCGFKFWDGRYIKKAIKKVEDDRWFFDSEILVRAQREGIAIYEMPVEWHEGENTKVKNADSVYFLTSILDLRRKLERP